MGGRQRTGGLGRAAIGQRVRRDGKFFRLGDAKWHPKGFAYGPFQPAEGESIGLPPPALARRDLEQIAGAGATLVRVYQTPPIWFLDLALELGLRVLVDVAWPSNQLFSEGAGSRRVRAAARRAVRKAARLCGNHPATFAISVANEIPADVVRYAGATATAELLDWLMAAGRAVAPSCLFTFANYPSTEYLRPRTADFLTFNVYLHDEGAFRNYLARLQSLAGDLPLVLGEYGIDTMQEATDAEQAERLAGHLRATFDEGLAGAIVFGFTDDWYVHGWQVDNWAFGVVRTQRDAGGTRIAKPALAAVGRVFRDAPHTAVLEGLPAWDALPKASVIVCSYNGASTVEACLKSLDRLNYPDYEVIFVDDGSTDDTQEIVRRFKRVRNLKQTNHGLSHARNVGMHAARGEIIVYTDSDCEADEDWLYHLVLAMKRSGHVGMGGPNLIPDEGDSDAGAVAEVVGRSPGGPTHVMVDDRTAEHVPGCNMAFYRGPALEIDGFDTQFRKAGDDVDFIWRLQDKGYTIGFAPAAQVWHYRRNSVEAYLKQQRGYGEAEALLQFKHPDRFNELGASLWHGRIYGPDGPGSVGLRFGRDIIYHGVQGTGLFQTIYRRPISLAAAMMMSLEWHLLALFIAILGIAWPSLLVLAGLMELASMGLSIAAAWQQPPFRRRRWWSRPLVAYLHWRQPIARGWARYRVRLKGKISGEGSFARPEPLPIDPQANHTLRYWWGHGYAEVPKTRFDLVRRLAIEARAAKTHVRPDSGWHGWDLELFGSRWAKSQVGTVAEKHADGSLVRVRVRTRLTGFAKSTLIASLVLAAVVSVTLVPLGLLTWIVPLGVWATASLAGWRLRRRAMRMIDYAAELEGFFGVFEREREAEPAPIEAPATERPVRSPEPELEASLA